MSEQSYIYIFIRKDLSQAQQIIQAAHVMYEVGIQQPEKNWPFAVLFGVADESELLDARGYLKEHSIKHEIFYEPDISATTAIATFPLTGAEREPLAGFETME